jgi:hypothetical protein
MLICYVMETKLTLRLEEKLIRKAKKHAKSRGKSVSKIVADYFALLDTETIAGSVSAPITESLWGRLEGKEVDEKDYKKYLEEKYL